MEENLKYQHVFAAQVSCTLVFMYFQAQNKGLSPVHVGIIFSMYSICGLFASIFIGIVVRCRLKFLVMTVFLKTIDYICKRRCKS